MSTPHTYKFLVKPVFFIISLLCAAYLVLKLEELKPEHVGLDIPMHDTIDKGKIKTDDPKRAVGEPEKAAINK